ncbi:MAG: SpoIIE family protein phosphatase [Acidobacteriota bacterium]|nr:SpoIIE family protein phosphatase [Acidobacteriota bacterium]MDH3785296.1 SpoIIE family protein phosphatase [Acidobacteriota bacterium]
MPGRGSPLGAKALERILEVTRDLARPLDIDTTLEHVIDAGRSILNAERGTVFLYDSENDELVTRVATGADEFRVPASKGIVGECARTRQVVIVPDCYADSRFNPEIDRKTGYRTRCLMAVPLIGHDDSLEGVLQVLNKRKGVFGSEDERIATALAAQCAVALQRSRLLREKVARERLEQELEVARSIQQRVFPQSMPTMDDYEVCGWARPADQTGGDIYDIHLQDDGGLILLLGDATGHGIGPALSVTQVRAMLCMCVRFGVDIDHAMQQINDQLALDLSSNRFVTAFLGRLDRDAHSVVYHAGGQGPLLHYHAQDDRGEWLTSTTRPLGMLGDLPVGPAHSMELAPGDLLLLSTDGIFEHERADEEAYGEQRILDVVRRHRDSPLASLIGAVIEDVDRFGDGAPQLDDMTVVVLRRRLAEKPEKRN